MPPRRSTVDSHVGDAWTLRRAGEWVQLDGGLYAFASQIRHPLATREGALAPEAPAAPNHALPSTRCESQRGCDTVRWRANATLPHEGARRAWALWGESLHWIC